jgi:hypothetical protein
MRNGTRYRLDVGSRVVAATVGGYAVTFLLVALLSLVLPGTRLAAVMTASMLSFAIYAVLVIWAFSVRTSGHAWLGVLCASGVLGIALALARHWAS